MDEKRAEELLRARRPELYRSNTQIYADAEKHALSVYGSKSHPKYNRERMLYVNNTQDSNKAGRESGLKEVRQEVYRAQVLEGQDRRNADQRANTEANEKTKAEGSKSAVVTGPQTTRTLTPQEQQRLNLAESQLQAGFMGNPNGMASFQKVQDYLKELADADPAEREQLLGQLQEEANALVDEPFNHKQKLVKDRLARKMQDLADEYGFLDKQELFKMEQAIHSLDMDAIAALDTDIDDLMKRGGLNSGLLRQIADEIIDKREYGVTEAGRIKGMNLEKARMFRGQGEADLNEAATEDLYDIEQGRDAERSIMLSDIIGDYSQQGLLGSLIGGAGEYGGTATGGEKRDSQGRPVSAVAKARATVLPTATAKEGSSLAIARKAQSGGMTVDEQRTARDKIMMTAPTVTSTPKSTTASTVRTSPTSGPVTAKTATGTTSAQRIELRRTQRLNR